jgi:two-component system, NarL family, nitrate/nitrite response regulator NarL
MAEPITVLIVEDSPLMAELLAVILGREDDLRVVGAAGSVREALQRARQEQPRVVLMDYNLPDGDGAQAAALIRQDRPQTAVVLLTADPSDPILCAAVEAGVCGFADKSQAGKQIAEVVRRAAAGEMLIPPATLAALVRRQPDRLEREAEIRAVRAAVTPRERKILGCLAQALNTPAIARELELTDQTVRSHIQHILEKLGAHSRLEAVVRAKAYGLLERTAR